MNPIKILAIILIVAGILALAYGKFSFTRESHEAKMGSMEFSVKNTETVNVPLWAGIAAVVAGGFLLLAPARLLPGH